MCLVYYLSFFQVNNMPSFLNHSFSTRALRRLISVHGRYSYIRMSKLILFSFYKNLVLIYPQFLFGFWSGWSGEPLYQEFVLTCFNIFFTSLPPFFIAIFEKDIQPETINKNPQTYPEVRGDYHFNLKRIAEWFGSSVVHGVSKCTIFPFFFAPRRHLLFVN